MKKEIKHDLKDISLIIIPFVLLLIVACFSDTLSKSEIISICINLLITILLNLAFCFFIKYILKKQFENPALICFLWSAILFIITFISNNMEVISGGSYILWYYINYNILKFPKEKFEDSQEDLEETEQYINKFKKINCRVCGKEIPYNEYRYL